jgi:hypothetical protein
MMWTAESLNAFKNYYGLTDKQIGAAVMERPAMVWKMRNGVIALDKYNSRLTGYLKAVKASKTAEHEQLILHFQAFDPDQPF